MIVGDTKCKSTKLSKNVSINKVVKCFKWKSQGYITSQCPKKRTMLIKENEDLENEKYDGYVEEGYQ